MRAWQERVAGRQAGGRGVAVPGKLTPYQHKRDFTRTPEPSGEPAAQTASQARGTAGQPAGEAATGARRFVVQRHRARRLHYDLRFEIGGVLASWAVPRGPTMDADVKRTAVHVEDHPLEYLDFEGVIPRGEYGAGDVIVWDRGTWEPHATDDPAAAVAAGELHVDVHGDKLRGRLILVRRGRDDASGPGSEQWLLVHKHDEYAVAGWDPEDHPASVLSGRTNEEVKADPERMWRPDLPAASASVRLRPPAVSGPSPGELAALDALGDRGTWEVFGRSLRLTNLGKELFPGRPGEPAVTKRELVRYSAQIAPVVLPYLAGRPLNMHRFPGGAQSAGFWHKQLPDHAPDWLPRWRDPAAEPGKTTTYLVADEPAALVWAANFGALEWHAWTARAGQPDRPSYALIDIDPGPATSWDEVLVLARLHRTALEHLGVRGQPKLTGRRGIQIWIPVAPGPSFSETRAWVEQLSRAIGAVVPQLVSWKWDVHDRGGLARLDYTQNSSNKTLVAPYSPRAAAGAPVSTPLEWDELDDPAPRPDSFTIRDIPARVARLGDPFRTVLDDGQVLPPVS
jgi:bifunctional non-homologous end joining protein LigD